MTPRFRQWSLSVLLGALLVALLLPATLSAQWTNRYPKLTGYSHHVYVEGYELPIMSAGVMDPAPSPDGRSIAFASHGWLWLLDVTSGEARRITSGGGIDARPAWRPDGRAIAFVRDDRGTTGLVVRDMASGAERELERGLVLDPAWSPDGTSIYYSSASAGDLDIWRIDLATGGKTRVTDGRGIERRPQPHPDGARLIYLAKPRGGADEVRVRSLVDGAESTLLAGNIVSQTQPALSPDGRTVAFNWPGVIGWELRLASVDRPGSTILLATREHARPLAPAWSADGATIYFSEGDRQQRMQLRRIAAVGGSVAAVEPSRLTWGVATGRIRITTRVDGGSAPAPARIGAMDANGHPLIPAAGQPRFDGQNGIVFFYSPGTVELEAPVGEIEVMAVQGLATPVRSQRVVVRAGQTSDVTLELRSVWDARAAGWYSGDHHFHLNYGGQFPLLPADLVPLLDGEAVDVATPLIANLHNRFEEQEFWRWRRAEPPLVRFGQEVRSHFLGHVGLVGLDTLFWPWIWGPGYEVYGRDDRRNVEPLEHARRQGGMGAYVHPVGTRDPFRNDESLASIPLSLVADAVQGHLDAIEIVCLWSDEIGTSEVWYRLLNIGMPVVPTAGTDVMTDFYRTMAVGTTRVYVRPERRFDWNSYFAALRAGRSVVSTGPMLDFRIGDARPGDVLPRGGSIAFTLDVHSAVPVDTVDVLVNGAVVWRGAGIDSAGSRRYSGTIRVPAGGWIAARAHGGETTRWPAMGSYAFAHTAPVWITKRGSTDAASARAAARDLLRALAVAERRLEAGYAGSEIPVLRRHFREARRVLEQRAR